MTGYVSKKMLGAARLPDTPSARAYLDKVLDDDDDTQVYKKPCVGLTDDAEILAISHTMPYANRFEFARAIEAKLKEKNCG
jgi:pseudouridine-5'-phosphate glycosidase